MAHFQVNNQSFPTRCEICHQADQFDPESNRCHRCAPLQAPKPRPWIEKMMFPATRRELWAWKLMLVTTGFVLIDSLVCSLYPLRAGVLGFLVYRLLDWDFSVSYLGAIYDERMCDWGRIHVEYLFLLLTNGITSLSLFAMNICSFLDFWSHPYKRLHFINLTQTPHQPGTEKKYHTLKMWRIPAFCLAAGGFLNLIVYGWLVFPTYTLGDAISYGYQPHIELKLLFNKNLHQKCQFGWTPLLYATAFRDQAMMQRLIQRGASVDAPSSTGLTPLMVAAALRSEELCSFLIDQGADTNRADTYGSTPIDFALKQTYLFDEPFSLSFSGAFSVSNDNPDQLNQTIALLRRHGARISGHTARRGKTTAQLAAENGLLELVKASVHEDPTQINQPDLNGETLLMSAAYKQNVDLVRFLIDQGADVNARTRFHYTVVHFATPNANSAEGEKTSIAIFQLLVQHGADLNAQGYSGDTALFYAAGGNHPRLLKFLLDHGADPTIRNKANRSAVDEAWHPAIHSDHTESIQILETAIAARSK
ncbi:MAG TPA: ankyrin repeat domain-containing protein [Acidobacteriota bacterium]|nr:ankyrin repeat domain-containing protein [Acidobacteriota bacterium]